MAGLCCGAVSGGAYGARDRPRIGGGQGARVGRAGMVKVWWGEGGHGGGSN
jgi:hypothetical protein